MLISWQFLWKGLSNSNGKDQWISQKLQSFNLTFSSKFQTPEFDLNTLNSNVKNLSRTIERIILHVYLYVFLLS